MNWKRFVALAFAPLAIVLFSFQPAWSQATISTGSIQGNILDPQGAGVPTAKVTITNKGTGAVLTPVVTSSGNYSSGALEPGSYVVRVQAANFKTVEVPIVVQVGNVSTANVTLEIGSASTVVEVVGQTVAVNTEQPTIQGVVTSQQIENLPINGRNFLDLAQLEPGVQIQDGGNFDPTKKGFSSVSFGGRFGRTARIEVDGFDISDETVGTTTQNVPMNSIREFQASQSTLDLGTELTSSGTLNVSTKSGTNQIHGGGFFGYRSDGTSANIGAPPNNSIFDRKQYGVDLGGPIFKNKLFAFGSFERVTQDLQGAVTLPDPFTALAGSSASPFHDQEYLGRLDYNVTSSIHMFFKFGYEQNRDVASFVPNTYQPFANVDNTPTYGVGADITTGTYTHSIRVGYLKFRNGITAASLPEGPMNPAPGLALAIGNVSTSCTVSGDLICTGTNILAPQATFQSNKQAKYDGSKVWGTHVLRYGIGVNRILGGGFANFFGLAPAVRAQVNPATTAFADGSPFAPGGSSNPLNWPVHRIDVANGEGCFTEIPQFGQPCGGQYDTRLNAYGGDSWKIKPNFTFTYGVRYNRDTGRTDSDLPAIPELNSFQPGLGDPVRQPNHNIGGLVGIAWDPWNNGKTVIRAGAGIYYENGVFNNILFDRPGRLHEGLFNQVQEACTQGGVLLPDQTLLTTIDGLSIPNDICGDKHSVGSVQQAIVDLQAAYQTATKAAGPQANGAYFGNCGNSTVCTGSMFAPNFTTPRSYQMNVGVQREIRPGTVLSVDYLRNVGVHTLLGVDQNHVGDSRFLDVPTATTAINTTNASFGCGTGLAGVDCAITKGATINDYGDNKVASLGGGIAATGGTAPGLGAVAFGGINPNFGQILLLEPAGRSVYNALQVVLRSDWHTSLPFVQHMNTQISYSLSRFNSQAQDLDFINNALNFRDPGKFIGPGSLDRTSQLSGGVVMQFKHGLRADLITHWYTALPQSLFFNAPGNASDIFQFDTQGDGQDPSPTTGAPITGTNLGSFGRSIKASGLNGFLQSYSATNGNQITPAGAALAAAGLMTTDQLKSLCAVTPSLNPINNCAALPGLQLSLAPAGQVGNDALFTFDTTLAWEVKPIRHWENFSITPNVKFFNLFNHPNYNGPTSLLSGVLDGSVGSVNGTTKALRRDQGVGLQGLGSGVFSFGAPRAIEFGIKANF